MSFSRLRKGLAALLCLLMIVSASSGIALAASADETQQFGNDFISVTVNKQNGRFTIRTKEGNPLKGTDNDKPLLYQGRVPETSFTTFRINGKDYVYGNDYGFLGMNGALTYAPTTQGLSNQTVWGVDGLEVTQTITLVEDKSNTNVGNVKISYQVKNKSNRTAQVGSRILLDTMMGVQDGSPISVSGGSQYLTNETSFEGDNIPYYWKTEDNPAMPKVTAYGFLKGWGNANPSRMVVAHWDGISGTKWDYNPNKDLNFTIAGNPYSSADSAVAFYWDPSGLAPGDSKVFETYYGLGSFSTAAKPPKFNLQLFVPKQLSLKDGWQGYKEETFEIRMEIDNTGKDKSALNSVKARLGLPAELELAVGEQLEKAVPNIPYGGSATVAWKVKPRPQLMYKAAQYRVSVSSSGNEDALQQGYVVLPAINGPQPKLQMLGVAPDKVYRQDANPSVTVKGSGFELLKGNQDVQVQLLRERDRQGFPIPLGDITVIDDGKLTVRIDDSLWPAALKQETGSFILRVDAGANGTFENRIEFTNDEKYKTRNYGILAVVGDNKTYTLQALDNEGKLDELKKNAAKKVLLEIRGTIKMTFDGSKNNYEYEVSPGATINSVIRYNEDAALKLLYGASSQKIMLAKTGGTVELSGNGVLSIPSFPFEAGPFSIKLEDGKDYTLDTSNLNNRKPVEIRWEVFKGLPMTQWMGNFPVDIKLAQVGDQTVSFGGTLSLKLGSKKDDDADRPSIKVEVNEAKFGTINIPNPKGEKQGMFGLVGLKAQGAANLPKNLIPGMNIGASGRVAIDTFARKYEIEAEVKFKVVEVSGLFTLRFTESSVPIPDNFVFVVGAQPGIPLIPTTPVAYITQGGGGFKNLYDTLMGNYNVLPPLQLMIIGGFDVAKVINGRNLTFAVSMRGVDFSGDLQIAGLDILKHVYGSIAIDDTIGDFAASISAGASIEILDIVKGQVYVVLQYDSSKHGLLGPVSMAGGGSIDVFVPKSIPLVGGVKLASAAGEISTEKLTGTVKFIGIPLAFKYVWGDSGVEVKAAEAGMTAGLGTQKVYDEANGNKSGVMSYGTNISKVAGSKNRPAANAKGLVSVSSLNDYSIPVEKQDYALLEFAYDGNEPKLEVLDPDGKPYELVKRVENVTEGNYYNQVIPAEESQSGKLEQRVYVTIQNPKSGNWTVKSDRPFDWSLMNVTAPPTLTGVNVEQDKTDDHKIRVDWKAEHAANEKVALYLSTNNTTDPGRKLLDGVDVDAGEAIVTLPETLASGDYYIKAVLHGADDTNHFSKYSTESVHIVNAHQPVQPSGVRLAPAGSGLIHAAWEMRGKADGYELQLLGADDKPIPDTGTIDVNSGQLEAVVGGVKPGSTYRVAVRAYNEVKGVKVFGEPEISKSLLLPEPNPAHVGLKLVKDNLELPYTTGENGEKLYIVNTNSVQLSIDADQPVQASIQVNEKSLSPVKVGNAGTEAAQISLVDLVEGPNLIQVDAANGQGDTTMAGIRIISDTTPPDLQIESLGGQASSEQTEQVKGKAEAGSKITVNGAPVEADETGRFTANVAMDGVLDKPVTVVAEDQAGNRTVFESKLFNSSVKQFDKVEIRPAGKTPADDGSLEVTVGKPQAFELVGIDHAGKPYVIDSGNVKWSLLLGEELGRMSADGSLKASEPGEMVVKASYALSETYALESSMIVKAVSGDGNPGGPGDYCDSHDCTFPPAGGNNGPDGNGSGDGDGNSGGSNGGGDTGSGKPGSSAGSKPSGSSDPLMDVLKSLIEYEKGVKFLLSVELSPGKDVVVPIGQRAVLAIPGQRWKAAAGIGIGKVQNPSGYETGPFEVIGDIYEMKLDKPERLEKPARLTVKFNLDEIRDLGKAAIYWYNDRERRWEYVGGQINPLEGTITAQLPHFSKYALVYNANWRNFADMADRWSKAAVGRLASIGVVSGVVVDGQDRFEPERPITRQEFAKLLVGASGVPVSAGVLGETFADRDQVSDWAAPFLATAVAKAWFSGSADSSGSLQLEPTRPITRAEAAAVAGRMLRGVADEDGAGALDFADAAQIPAWAQPLVATLQANGILHGYDDRTFRPDALISREEAAAMIGGMLDLSYAKGKSIP